MSNAINFDYFLDDVAPAIDGAQIPLLLVHIRNAAIKFCDQSWAWQVEGLPLSVVAQDATYDLVSPIPNAEITQILRVVLDGTELAGSSWAKIQISNKNAATKKGNPNKYWQENASQLRLFPIPEFANVQGLAYRMALRPSRIATGMDGDVAKRYFDAIADQAKSTLYKIPNKPWSDGAASVFHSGEYKKAVALAKIESMRGFTRGALRTVAY